jgi:hypothetical protein
MAGGQMTRQEEDHDGDGVADARFEGDQAASVPPGTKLPGARFSKLDCGRFSRFWARR